MSKTKLLPFWNFTTVLKSDVPDKIFAFYLFIFLNLNLFILIGG